MLLVSSSCFGSSVWANRWLGSCSSNVADVLGACSHARKLETHKHENSSSNKRERVKHKSADTKHPVEQPDPSQQANQSNINVLAHNVNKQASSYSSKQTSKSQARRHTRKQPTNGPTSSTQTAKHAHASTHKHTSTQKAKHTHTHTHRFPHPKENSVKPISAAKLCSICPVIFCAQIDK